MMTPSYSVYALRYGCHQSRKWRENLLYKDIHDDQEMPLDFYFWVIPMANRVVLVDTGFDKAAATKRNRLLIHEPTYLLSQLDIAPADVTDVIITHMHYDHAGNLDLFPNAIFHVQEEELAFCTGKSMGHKPLRHPIECEHVTSAIRILFGDRMVFYKGNAALVDGINLIHIGGHTPGLQAVKINTERGNIILASDAIHYWDNMVETNPFPIFIDLPRVLDGYSAIRNQVHTLTHVIPGHDPKVSTVFAPHDRCSDILQLHLPPVRNLII